MNSSSAGEPQNRWFPVTYPQWDADFTYVYPPQVLDITELKEELIALREEVKKLHKAVKALHNEI